MNKIKKVLVNNLRFYRNRRKLTQTKIAEIINVSTTYYNSIENGKYFPSAEVLECLCNYYNILPYQLFLENPTDFESSTKIDNYSKLKKDLKSVIEKYGF